MEPIQDEPVERRAIQRVVVDSIENGAAISLRWLVRGVWSLVLVLVTGAFWVGAQGRQIDINTQAQSMIAEQHVAMLEALARIGANQEILLEDRRDAQN